MLNISQNTSHMRIADFRIIARLDIKNEYVIKGIHLEGLRKVGKPIEFATKYYLDGADEIFLQDSVASLYGRNNLYDVLANACREVFVPIVIGGGLRSIEDVEKALSAGADRVSINTALIENPRLIESIASRYGSQCIACSIEAKKDEGRDGKWRVYYDCGREDSGKDLVDWVKCVQDLGVGEIFLTSIDHEGTKSGFDLELCETVRKITSIPLIASGGAGTKDHVLELYLSNLVDGVALASLIHYNIENIYTIKKHLEP